MVGDGSRQAARAPLLQRRAPTSAQRQVQQVNSGNCQSSFNWKSLLALQFSLKDDRTRATRLVPAEPHGDGCVAQHGEGSDGHPIYTMVVDPTNGFLRERINGRAAYFASDMPEVASNAIVAAYGDFRQAYLIVDRMGIRVLRDPYTDKPFVKFYTTKRVGGDVVNYEAVKLLKIAA